ncbi:DUF5979 domain-containing protein [Microbacterium sp. A204]|uniref:DUF5979 domain-containing protein n=1 Tax=Microbacterium sp. A204 TaxID=3457321 RepID=UPI003FD21C15
MGAVTLTAVGLVALPATAMAAANNAIVVDAVTTGGGTGVDGQLVIGDTIEISGTWDASAADPHKDDIFMIGLPQELNIPTDVPFNLTGPRPDGSTAIWAMCLATAGVDEVVCTLTDEVEANPELVGGTFSFDVKAVEATTEKALEFDLNGSTSLVVLPSGGGIDDGIVIPDNWDKSGAMNANNWSMTWTINLPGASLQGHDVVNIADTLSANHVLCAAPNLKVETVRGNNVVDVTSIAAIAAGTGGADFNIVLTAPGAGFDPNVTYRITYETCTTDGQIDPAGTEYTNEASIDIWGNASSGIQGVTSKPWRMDLTKSGSVLDGKDRNGKIAWTVTVPGSQLVGKNGFRFTEKLGAGHELCTDTITGIKITERYGPSSQIVKDVTPLLTPTVVSSSTQGFEIQFTINDTDFAFKASDYRYIVTYDTCVTDKNLPAAGTAYTNSVDVDGKIAGTEAKVPGRTDEKGGSINTKAVTLDGVDYLPQTTMNWQITVPGERLVGLTGDLTVTDTLSSAHQVCTAGDPTGGLNARLGLKLEARDQISNGGLKTVDLTDTVTAAQDADDAQKLTFTVPQPTLEQPDGTTQTGFSREYQYVISYTTCTTTGGMDAPGTTYGNTATVNGKTYEKSVTQSNRGSGSGSGVPRGSMAISKLIADTPGAAFVPADAMFTVHVQEFDPSGTMQLEYDRQVPLNGDAVSGPNSRGTGWTAKITEPTFPSIPGVAFGTPVFTESAGVIVSDGGTVATVSLAPGKNIAVGLTNTAQLGSLSIVKAVTGGAAALVDDAKNYKVTAKIDTSALGATFPAQPDRVVDLTEGAPATLSDLPIGAVVTFSEAAPANDDRLTWGTPVFSPQSVAITAAHASAPASVALTNSVERTVGTFSLVKTVTGEQAANPAVPASVTVTATWDEEGTEGTKTLTVPTDGTPLPLGENLLIGTEVTLSETPLSDGSSIAWGSPTWSGTGVTVEGSDAVVTIGRDAAATVTLENHAATSVAGLNLIKGIAGEATGEVDSDTEFPVTATWTDGEGIEQSKNITINAVEPTLLGDDFLAGTVVMITEGERPGIDTVIWDSITITGDGVTDNGDGSAEIIVSDQHTDATLVTVTNEATWAPGTFNLAKDVSGVLLNNSDVPDEVLVTASWFEDGEPFAQDVTVPTNGTVVPFGGDLPHGTEVTLTEHAPVDGAAFTWDAPIWDAVGIVLHGDGSATITIGAATDVDVVLTNNATASLGSLWVRKTLSGDSDVVPADVVFPVIATWTDLMGEEQRVTLDLKAGTPGVIEGLPLGTEVALTEDSATGLPANAKWLGAVWSSESADVAIDGEGTEVVVTVTGEPGVDAEISLDNEFERIPDLATTGGGLVPAGLIAAMMALIGGGALLLIKRRRLEA